MKITKSRLMEIIKEELSLVLEEKKNPYAICTASIAKTAGTSKRSEWSEAEEERYEKCKKDVEKENK